MRFFLHRHLSKIKKWNVNQLADALLMVSLGKRLRCVPTSEPHGGLICWYGTQRAFYQVRRDWLLLKQERIIGSSVLHESGVLFVVLEPGRHHHAHHSMSDKGMPFMAAEREDGFLTSHGRHIGREEALIVATAAKQVLRRTGSGGAELFSEDLW